MNVCCSLNRHVVEFVLILCVSGCLSMTWLKWLPAPGFRIGMSNETATAFELITKCQQYNAIPPEDGKQVDIQKPEFFAFIASVVPPQELCWLANTRDIYGFPEALTVYFESTSVYALYSDCQYTYKYICYGPEPTDTTISATTAPDTTPDLTTPAGSTLDAHSSSVTSPEASWQPEASTPEVTSYDAANGSPANRTAANLTEADATRSGGLGQDGEDPGTTTTVTLSYDVNTAPSEDYRFYSSELSWNQWTPWTACTATCNGGQKLRLQLCQNMLECRYQLTDVRNITISYDIETGLCNKQPCPIDGFWATWSAWTQCSATCAVGTRRRHRLCVGPYFGGLSCEGRPQENDFCETKRACSEIFKEPPIQEKAFTESDSRPSAIGVGVISLIFILVEALLILLMDASIIAHYCQQRKRPEARTANPSGDVSEITGDGAPETRDSTGSGGRLSATSTNNSQAETETSSTDYVSLGRED